EQLEVLTTLARTNVRMADYGYQWTLGWMEHVAREEGYTLWLTEVPPAQEDVIMQGPHFTVANPYNKQPNENCRSKSDYSEWDLEILPETLIPRTNYQRA